MLVQETNRRGVARAVGPWFIDDNLVYRLNQFGTNHEEIRVTRTEGSPHNERKMHRQALVLQKYLNDRDGYKNPPNIDERDWWLELIDDDGE